MSHSPAHGNHEPEGFDRELDVSGIVKVGVGTVIVTVVAMVLMWWMLGGIERFTEKQDPAQPTLAEAREKTPPPLPLLEVSPPASLKVLRDHEAEVLGQPAWVDEGQGIVRLPIDLALDVVARRGLPGVPAAPAAPAAGTPGATTPTPSQNATAAPAAAGAGH